MKADEIRNTLKPMADFAPAILRAAEIVEAAEVADKKVAELDAVIVEKQRTIAVSDTELQRYQNLAKMAQQNYTATRDDLTKQIGGVEATLAQAQANADKAIAALNLTAQKKQDEIKALNIEIEEKKAQLVQAKQSLKEWAEANSLKVA